jgi:hypothetical protein
MRGPVDIFEDTGDNLGDGAGDDRGDAGGDGGNGGNANGNGGGVGGNDFEVMRESKRVGEIGSPDVGLVRSPRKKDRREKLGVAAPDELARGV